MWIAVWPERSSCPCFAAALAGKPVSRSDGSWNFQGTASRKRKIPPTQYRRRILSGETDGKMIGCVARRYVLSGQSLTESGGYHGENHHFFSRIWNKRYHGSVGASIWFCDFYCDKAIEVRLIIANWFFNVSETSLVCISRIGDSVHNNISFCVNAGVIVSAGYIQ